MHSAETAEKGEQNLGSVTATLALYLETTPRAQCGAGAPRAQDPAQPRRWTWQLKTRHAASAGQVGEGSCAEKEPHEATRRIPRLCGHALTAHHQGKVREAAQEQRPMASRQPPKNTARRPHDASTSGGKLYQPYERQHRLKHTSKDGDDRQANWLPDKTQPFLKAGQQNPEAQRPQKHPHQPKLTRAQRGREMQSGFKKEKNSSPDPEIIEIMKLADKKIRNLLQCKGNQGQKKRTANLNR